MNPAAFSNYSRVKIVSSRFISEGVSAGSHGYIIDVYPDGAYEVEVSAPDGTTVALLIAKEDDLELDELSTP